MLILIALISSALAMALLATASDWQARLHPARMILSIHLVYNAWAIAFANPTQLASLYAAFTISSIGLVAGIGIATAIATQSRTQSVGVPWKHLRFTFNPTVAAGLVAVGGATFAYLIAQAGTVPILSPNANLSRLTFFTSGVTSTFFVVAAKALIAGSGLVAMTSSGKRRRVALWIGVATITAIAATANRGLVVQPLIPVALFALVKFGFGLTKTAAFAFLALGLFSLAGYARNVGSFGSSYVRDLEDLGYSGLSRFFAPLQLYVAGTAQTFERTVNFFPSIVPFQQGGQFFGPLMLRESADLYLKKVFALDFEGFGLALGAMNAFYLDWGMGGIAVGFVIGGLVIGTFHNLARGAPERWLPMYLVLVGAYLLANYGHPFAYLASAVVPIATALIVKTARTDA